MSKSMDQMNFEELTHLLTLAQHKRTYTTTPEIREEAREEIRQIFQYRDALETNLPRRKPLRGMKAFRRTI